MADAFTGFGAGPFGAPVLQPAAITVTVSGQSVAISSANLEQVTVDGVVVWQVPGNQTPPIASTESELSDFS